jgi:hypothetical protein
MIIRKAAMSDIERIKKVGLEWKETCKAGCFKLAVSEHKFFSGLEDMIYDDDADVFMLIDNDKVVGFMGMEWFSSPLGDQRIANEHYWYILKECRGSGAMLMVSAARTWAKEKRCSHLVMNASTLASELHDKVCGIYERIGLKKFETSYIQEIK